MRFEPRVVAGCRADQDCASLDILNGAADVCEEISWFERRTRHRAKCTPSIWQVPGRHRARDGQLASRTVPLDSN
jgi:hypothetical protein